MPNSEDICVGHRGHCSFCLKRFENVKKKRKKKKPNLTKNVYMRKINSKSTQKFSNSQTDLRSLAIETG